MYTIKRDYNEETKDLLKKLTAVEYKMLEYNENFEKIFKYSYDEYFFSNKNIIFEIANIIKLESI